MAAGLPPSRPAFFTRIRSVLRSAEYRAERRQLGRLYPILTLAGGVLFPPAILIVPAGRAGRSVRQERIQETLEAALLCPGDRAPMLWAKLLAALRPAFWFALACPAIGAALGLIFDPEGVSFVGGLLLGVGAGIAVPGEVLLLAALSMYFDLRFRNWLASTSLWLVSAMLVHAIELPGLCLAISLTVVLTDFLIVPAVALGVLFILARMVLVNVLLPEAVMAHCAAQFDRLALGHIAAKEG